MPRKSITPLLIKSLAMSFCLAALTAVAANASSMEDAETAWHQNDYAKYVQILEELSKEGDARAEFELGLVYKDGTCGVEKNATKAFDLLKLSAYSDQVPAAQNTLACWFSQGVNGQPPDDKAAFDYNLRAAKHGMHQSQYNVGLAFATGKGVKQDYAVAVIWYEEAVKRGNPHAKNNMSCLLQEGGHGLEADIPRALKLRRQAAEGGCPFAQQNLAHAYESGRNCRKDMKMALYWYDKCIAQNVDAWPARHVGTLYEYGVDLRRDRKLAIAYYAKAAKLGDQIAESRIKDLSKH